MKKRSSVKPSDFKTQLIKKESTDYFKREITPDPVNSELKSVQKEPKVKRVKIMNLDDLEIVETIGRGAFGDVKLVQHKESKVAYAMKILSKEDIINDKAIEQIKNEKNILKFVTQDSAAQIKAETLIPDIRDSPEMGKSGQRKLKTKASLANLTLPIKTGRAQ